MASRLVSSSICLCLCLGLHRQPPSLMAQNENQASSASNQQETQPPSEDHKAIVLPAPLGGVSPHLTANPEDTLPRPNLLTGSIGVSGVYTDNAFTVGSKAVSDYQYSIIPGLGFQTFGSRTQWTLHYGGGLTIDQRLAGSTQQTHDATVAVSHSFTRRLAAELRQDYSITNNPFTRIGESQSLSAVTGPGQLSPFSVPSTATRIGSISGANLTYQLSPHSGMGASGSFSSQHFRDVQSPSGTTVGLLDTTTTAGRAFYLLQISPHQTIGTEYQLQDLRFAGGLARTVDHTLFLFDGISFRKNMTLSLYGGPERTHTHNVIFLDPNLTLSLAPVLADQWSVGGGLAYTWQGKHNGFRISGERGVSDGGGFAGAVRLHTASLEWQKAWGPRWSTTLELIYADGRSIAVPPNVSGGRITTEQGLLGFLYQLTPNVALTAQYARIQQPYAGPISKTVLPNHDQVQAGLTYRFQKVFAQ